ncbi:MAG: oligopeptide transporter, OPT family [Acidobacteria bacterium]|nr:oligopeptide transporter, OPT family [Acidobacteriota bacterium]
MTPPETDKKFRSYVPDKTDLREFTIRAVLLGLVMTVVLGAANLYLGLRAGMTIAATYPAAVIGMAILRLMKGSILEENMARTIGSIGESVAAGAVFTIPAFVLSGVWPAFDVAHGYWKSVALMAVGGTLGILFVTLLRRVMVEDPDLPFPESVAASEIHKAGQQGARAAQILFANMALGATVYFLGAINVFAASRDFVVKVGQIGLSMIKLTRAPGAPTVQAGAMSTFSAPAISPAYLGVGYIIGPRLGALNFAGGVFAWGLLVPLLAFFLGPQLAGSAGGTEEGWAGVAGAIWYHIVRPIAVGGMMVGASYTLFRMRKNLGLGMKRAVADLKKSASAHEATGRTQRDLNSKVVFGGLGVVFLCMIALYLYFAGEISAAVLAAAVMIVLGFFFAAVSGNLVGMIGSSNNPISGLTLCTVVIAALLMVALGLRGNAGISAVLGVAAVVCVSSAVAGEMLQDLKAGHILGGTPAKMQIGDLMGIAVSSMALFFPLMWLHRAYTFGTPQLSAPQAGLMASLAQGIVGGAMAWPLVVVGILMGFGLILVEVKSPMLFSVGMYLPLETTFAIFVGGLFRWVTDKLRDKGGFNDAQKARIENAGVLTASGLIAGEALCGLVVAGFRAAEKGKGHAILPDATWSGTPWLSILVLVGLAALMIRLPLKNAGRPDEPAPPTAIM